MKKLSVNLKNCYGIKKLDFEFSFEKKRIYAIYSPNGVMKTSFAKTFSDVSEGCESHDIVFPDEKSIRKITDENKIDIAKENILVVEPYNETYKSEKIATLLVNAKLRNEYEGININIETRKNDLLSSLKKLSGIKTDIEDVISKAFTNLDNGFYTAIMRAKDEVLQDTPPQFTGVIYSDVFSEKTEQFLSSDDIRQKITDYITKYDELIGNSKYLKRGVFNHTNASTIAKNLKENGFFQAEHTVNLVSSDDKKEIKTDKELEEIIEAEKTKILTDPDLVKIFNTLDKKLSANKDLRDFREYLLQNVSILPELSNLEAFKEKLWISYFKLSKDIFVLFADEYEKGRKDIEKIVAQAKKEATQWSNVIEIFNKRFSVPFKLSIGNQEQVILNSRAPVIQFDFIDRSSEKTIKEEELLKVLSTGEKRALYLLNILFEVEARRESNIETIFILDDIADSFDYKNKYAIIEYLKDLSEFDLFYQIILTHNYDFFRTVSSRLGMSREYKLNTEKNEVEITLSEEKYQNNPFEYWKKHLNTDKAMLVASIPFIRNLAEYIGEHTMFQNLTSLLHYKKNTASIKISDLENYIKKVLYRSEFANLA